MFIYECPFKLTPKTGQRCLFRFVCNMLIKFTQALQTTINLSEPIYDVNMISPYITDVYITTKPRYYGRMTRNIILVTVLAARLNSCRCLFNAPMVSAYLNQ